jgi:hypothetical protein
MRPARQSDHDKTAADMFFGGIPTAPDVEKLVEKFGVPAVGLLISYAEVTAVIREEKESFRFKSITTAWRKLLYNEHNLVLKAVATQGYEVLDNKQRVTFSTGKYKHGLKHIRKSADIASRTAEDGLSNEEKRARDHIVHTSGLLQLAAATEARKLRYPGK